MHQGNQQGGWQQPGQGGGGYGFQPGHGYQVQAGPGVATSDAREKFIVRTYNHLFVAILAFAGIEIALFKANLAEPIAQAMLGTSWLLVLGAFMVVSWVAARAVNTSQSKASQYAALAGFVVAEAIVFIPLLYIADAYAPGAIQSAALVTMVGFAGLTGIAFWTRKDFSFLGGVLKYGMLMALVAIGASLIFGFSLGVFFSVAMVGLAGAAILYDTSKILKSFPLDRHVAAALHLFSSVALMFWYVLSIFISRR